MLIGSFNHTIDQKGRVFVPAKWRQDLGENFVVTRGIGGCLFGMSLMEWSKLSDKLSALPLSDQKAQSISRNLSRWAIECEPDKQGRILIPQKLRSIVNIKTEVIWIGMTNHVEIWDSEVLEAKDAADEDSYDSMLAEAAEYGI